MQHTSSVMSCMIVTEAHHRSITDPSGLGISGTFRGDNPTTSSLFVHGFGSCGLYPFGKATLIFRLLIKTFMALHA
ncbi:hypothetical protein BJX63DRAFT_383710 [Aspergillus granulosus]|uniref:Uncharacterized protein n=1 Tax=Aspergillus granulosus TaxID=176169 RepID=A0ABR4HT39_9EURO